MGVENNRNAIVYLAITFAFSWTIVTLAWLNGARSIGDAAGASQLFTYGPPVAAVICALLFHRGERLNALGLRFEPNRWWLIACVVAFAMAGYTLTVGAIIPQLATGQIGDVQANAAMLTQRQAADMPAGPLGAILILAIAALGFSILFTLTEEMGWRGYLYRQWRQLGFWRFSLLQGVIWGVWHWPLVIYFGMVFADNRLAGLAFYPLMTMIASPIATLLRDRGGSIWAPGIWHGTHNAIGIVVMGQLFVKTDPVFLALLANLPLLALLEWLRRKWPSEPVF